MDQSQMFESKILHLCSNPQRFVSKPWNFPTKKDAESGRFLPQTPKWPSTLRWLGERLALLYHHVACSSARNADRWIFLRPRRVFRRLFAFFAFRHHEETTTHDGGKAPGEKKDIRRAFFSSASQKCRNFATSKWQRQLRSPTTAFERAWDGRSRLVCCIKPMSKSQKGWACFQTPDCVGSVVLWFSYFEIGLCWHSSHFNLHLHLDVPHSKTMS